ncbi:MAG TPA: hypothetical protein VFN94_06585 [Nitrospiria bacterium]|nr:hypothetical protein [Nitrospiria bacterium]
MIRRLCAWTGRGIVWIAVFALSVLPFVHAHAGVTWSHTGDHAHPPVVHSIFTFDEAAHPPEEPDLPVHGRALAAASHDFGHQIDLVSGATPAPTVVGVLALVGIFSSLPSIRQPVPAGVSRTVLVLGAATAPRAPPVPSLS